MATFNHIRVSYFPITMELRESSSIADSKYNVLLQLANWSTRKIMHAHILTLYTLSIY